MLQNGRVTVFIVSKLLREKQQEGVKLPPNPNHIMVNKPTNNKQFLDLSASYLVFEINPVVSIAFTIATNLSYTAFFTKSLFTALPSLLISTGTVFNLHISILSTSGFNLAKFNLDPKLELSILLLLLLNQLLLHNQTNLV